MEIIPTNTNPKDHQFESTLNKAQIAELEKAQSLSKIIYTQFKEHKAAVIGAYTILFFVIIALSAPLIGMMMGVNSENQNVFHRYEPPFSTVSAGVDTRETEVRIFIQENPESAALVQQELLKEEFVTSTRPEDALYDWAKFEKRKALAAIRYLNVDDNVKSDLRKIAKKFETYHLFGTDELGRDVLMRLIYGTQISMSVGILVALSSAFIGLLIMAPILAISAISAMSSLMVMRAISDRFALRLPGPAARYVFAVSIIAL